MIRSIARTAVLAIGLVATTIAHAATYTVTRADDPASATSCGADDCTLRAAILAANANAGPDTIAFAVPTTDPNGEAVLVLERDLPPLTGTGTTIDGYTQPGAAQTTSLAKNLWEGRKPRRSSLWTSAAPSGLPPLPQEHAAGDALVSARPTFPHHIRITLEPRTQVPYPYIGLTLEGTGHRVEGLAIRSFYYAQIDVRGSGHVVSRNLIGLAAFERAPYRTEPFFGIRLRDVGAAVTGNVIGGSALDGNVFGHVHTAISLVGVGADGAPPNRIAGNLVGVAPDGVRMLPLTRGIELRDSEATIVGADPGDAAASPKTLGPGFRRDDAQCASCRSAVGGASAPTPAATTFGVTVGGASAPTPFATTSGITVGGAGAPTPATTTSGVTVGGAEAPTLSTQASDFAGNTIAGIGPRESVGIERLRATATIDGNTIGGTLSPNVLPHHLARAIDTDARESTLGDNTIIDANTGAEAAAPDTIAFSRALAIAPGTLGTTQSVLVRRTGPATQPASIEIRELDSAAQSFFATDPPALATGGYATLHWSAGDTTPRVVTATFIGYGSPGPYGDATKPYPYGTELRLALANPSGATLGAIDATRLTLHTDDAIALARFDRAIGPASASFE